MGGRGPVFFQPHYVVAVPLALRLSRLCLVDGLVLPVRAAGVEREKSVNDFLPRRVSAIHMAGNLDARCDTVREVRAEQISHGLLPANVVLVNEQTAKSGEGFEGQSRAWCDRGRLEWAVAPGRPGHVVAGEDQPILEGEGTANQGKKIRHKKGQAGKFQKEKNC